MIQIAIDGASKGNGKVDCISGSGVVVIHDGIYKTVMMHEEGSTNQRGEINALILALRYCSQYPSEEAQIITDSEYILNTVTKEWYKSWVSRGWLTKDGNPVKNQDLWESVAGLLEQDHDAPLLYHIKGHLIPDGGQTAMNLLDEGVDKLYALYESKFDEYVVGNDAKITKAQGLSEKNNGFEFNYETFKRFVVLNGVADRIAVKALIDAKN